MAAVRLKVHVEADAEPPRYRSSIVYLTADEPIEGAELVVRLKGGVAVTGFWPRRPDSADERGAAWRVDAYPRPFGDRVVYSFGVRLDLDGEARLSARVARWRARGPAVELEAAREGGLRAVVGPLAPGFRILGSLGALSLVGEPAARYVVVEGGLLRLELEVPPSPVVAGYLEYPPDPGELPFDAEVRGAEVSEVERTLVARLRDLGAG